MCIFRKKNRKLIRKRKGKTENAKLSQMTLKVPQTWQLLWGSQVLGLPKSDSYLQFKNIQTTSDCDCALMYLYFRCIYDSCTCKIFQELELCNIAKKIKYKSCNIKQSNKENSQS